MNNNIIKTNNKMELEAGSLIGQRVEYKKQKGTILYQGCLKHNTNKDK